MPINLMIECYITNQFPIYIMLLNQRGLYSLNSSDAGDGIFQPVHGLAPKVARASAGMVLAGQDRQHAFLFQS